MKQKALKLKESGSLLNWMMSNNSTPCCRSGHDRATLVRPRLDPSF